MRVHPGITYTFARLGLFLAAGGVLYLLGFRAWALALGALLISLPLSWFLLRAQREKFAQRVERRHAERAREKERLRKALRGEDEPPHS